MGFTKLFLYKGAIRGPLGETIGYKKEFHLDTGSGRSDRNLQLIGEVEMSDETRSLVDALCFLQHATKDNLIVCLKEIVNKCIQLSQKK